MKSEQPFSLFRLLRLLLADDRQFAWVTIIYGVVVSLLSLAIPFSVQMLIETVTNTANLRAIFTLALLLFAALTLSGIFVALQLYLVELFERRFYARICSEIVLRTLYADPKLIEQFNAEELQNRYFEIMSLQTRIPALLVGGVTLLETTLVGFIIVSLYHPFFLYFILAFTAVAFLIWRIVHRPALNTAIENSTDKFAMAKWLETIAKNHALFRGEKKMEYAIQESEQLTANYVDSHRRHFSFTFFQNIGFLSLYAVGSASLLGIGGWLITQNELTVGQLVAAELVLSAIFVGLSRFGFYLEMYYDICASMVKLSHFFDLDIEAPKNTHNTQDWQASLRFNDVELRYRNQSLNYDLDFPANTLSLISSDNSLYTKAFIDLAQGFQAPDSGEIWFGDTEIRDQNLHQLRDQVAVIDNFLFPELSIEGFLKIARPETTHAEISKALTQVGLKDLIDDFPEQLQTQLTPRGYPLSKGEVLRLKLAFALLNKAKIIILTPTFDILQWSYRTQILEQLKQQPDLTVVYWSNRRDLECFDHYYYVKQDSSLKCDDIQQMKTLDESNS